jgi:transcriptional regulator with XRE-family HTH domain
MPSSLPTTLGRRVADCRERLGWTQRILAKNAGLSVTFVSEVENDRRSPGTDALRSLADALGASLDYLVKGVTDAVVIRRPLFIPPELAEAAEEGRWSLPDASALVRMRDTAFARRSAGGEIDRAGRSLSKSEWQELYELYIRFVANPSDGSSRT